MITGSLATVALFGLATAVLFLRATRDVAASATKAELN
jgi:hypothetical protein